MGKPRVNLRLLVAFLAIAGSAACAFISFSYAFAALQAAARTSPKPPYGKQIEALLATQGSACANAEADFDEPVVLDR